MTTQNSESTTTNNCVPFIKVNNISLRYNFLAMDDDLNLHAFDRLPYKDYNRDPSEWVVDEGLYMRVDPDEVNQWDWQALKTGGWENSLRIIKHGESKEATQMCDCLTQDFLYTAVDMDGKMYGYIERPRRSKTEWEAPSIKAPINPLGTYDSDRWANTLTRHSKPEFIIYGVSHEYKWFAMQQDGTMDLFKVHPYKTEDNLYVAPGPQPMRLSPSTVVTRPDTGLYAIEHRPAQAERVSQLVGISSKYKYTAQDRDGTQWLFTDLPYMEDDSWWCSKGRTEEVFTLTKEDDWQLSLRRTERYEDMQTRRFVDCYQDQMPWQGLSHEQCHDLLMETLEEYL